MSKPLYVHIQPWNYKLLLVKHNFTAILHSLKRRDISLQGRITRIPPQVFFSLPGDPPLPLYHNQKPFGDGIDFAKIVEIDDDPALWPSVEESNFFVILSRLETWVV